MFERIVAAIDIDPERSAKVVEATKELAQARRSKVLVAHVREVERPATLLAKAGAVPPSLHLEDREAAKELIEDAVEALRREGVDVRGEFEADGSTATHLLAIAKNFKANLIVVADREAKVSDLIQGGVAHRIVHQAESPVLVVR
jgi:nucleotide-binding universal stress UspA family protein